VRLGRITNSRVLVWWAELLLRLGGWCRKAGTYIIVSEQRPSGFAPRSWCWPVPNTP